MPNHKIFLQKICTIQKNVVPLHPLLTKCRSRAATLAQLVEQRIRNA